MKLCKDCKWMRDQGEYAVCAYPVARAQKRTGFETKSDRDIEYCSIQRDAGWLWMLVAPQGRCGKMGRWFEASGAD